MENNSKSIEDYINKKKTEISEILKESKLSNYYYQANAKKIGANFEPKYSEEYLWRRALILVSYGCKILMHEPDNFESSKAIHYAARIYEVLHYTSTEYDKEYCAVISSLCYDIAGYHANALCLIKNIYHLDDENHNYEDENYILANIQLFMLSKLKSLSEFSMRFSNKGEIVNSSEMFSMLSDFFLNGSNVTNLSELNEFDELIEKRMNLALSECMYSGDVMFSQLFFLLRAKYRLLKNKSIPHIFYQQGKLPNKIWERYIKILGHNMYRDAKIIPPKERISIIEFWNSQLKAIEKGILRENKNYIIQMPTSAGKTFIAEMIILNHLIETAGKKCIYIAPFKSLVNQVEETLNDHLGRMGFIVSTIIGNYELDQFDNLLIHEADVLVATPEKVDLILRLMPEFFDNVSNIIFDEGHVLGNVDTRASLMEFLITRIKNKLGDKVSFVFISAVMPDSSVESISQWLAIKNENKINSKSKDGEKWQPTRSLISKFEWYGNLGRLEYTELKVSDNNNAFVPGIIESKKYTFLNTETRRNNSTYFPSTRSKSDTAVELATKFEDQGPVLIFCAQPRNANSVANSYINMTKLKGILVNKEIFIHLPSYEIASSILGEESETAKFLSHGIGVHTGVLPQIIRKAIEQDYKNKKLKLLIATNTLGQGVNLPIKTIIIHSVNISQGNNVSNRDFWNIIGRAGRAGKETEGQIIYLCNTENDKDLFASYIDENKIEPVNSIFYYIVKALVNRRITNDELRDILAETIEPQLFAMLVEEVVDTPDENVIKKIIGTSLFNIQLEKEPKLTSNNELADELLKISKRFYNTANDITKRKAFARTGFSLESSTYLVEYIESNFGDLYFKLQTDLLEFIVEVLSCIKDVREMQSSKQSINELCERADIFDSLIRMWIIGKPINEMRSYLIDKDSETSQLLNEFIETMFSYRYSWGVTSFVILFKYVLDKRELEQIDIINYIPTFVKHGTNKIFASWAKSLGVPTRESANVIGSYYEKEFGENYDLKLFVHWFSNISQEELKEILNNAVRYEIEIILNTAQKINSGKYYNVDNDKEYIFNVMGIKYYPESIVLAKKINVNEEIILLRDYNNPYDSFAIKVLYDDIFLGYVPRDLAKEISIQIDLNGLQFSGYVKKKRKKSTGIDIMVSVTKK